MDLVLKYCDQFFFTPYIYPSTWPEHNIWRQFFTLTVVVNLGAVVLYLGTASFNYYFIYDHNLKKHPQYLKNQIQMEISYALSSIPLMSLPTLSIFILEVRGFSRLYDDMVDASYGWFSILWGVLTFILFTDCLIYWIHRALHSRLLYKRFHKQHHKWKIPTPFASHAFHPLDGFAQSSPYHIFVFLLPLHKLTYLALFVAVNIWTVSIHDGDYRVPWYLRPWINGSAHHMDHHLYYNYNYGQFFTLWDRLGGSFREPSSFQGWGPLDFIRNPEDWKRAQMSSSSTTNGLDQRHCEMCKNANNAEKEE